VGAAARAAGGHAGLFGLDPDRAAGDVDLAEEFERALAYYGRDYFLQSLRGPRSPWRALQASRRRLDRVLFTEIARRRKRGADGEDILSLLLAATDEDGSALTDRQVRDQVITLLFAGHDTTTSTVAFLFYELARNPRERPPLLEELDKVLDGRRPTAAELVGELPRLEMAMDETLRMYPPAWIGPRRAIHEYEFEGHVVPAGARVNYCSWASHHLADVFEDPFAFVPERFAPSARRCCPRAPTCRSGAARGPASACASVSSRSWRSRRRCCSASRSSCNRDTACASARCRRSRRAMDCR
jgi:cytochrome P450